MSESVSTLKLKYDLIRNCTPPGLKDITVYHAVVPWSQVVDIPDHENVRKFLPDTPNRSRRAYTQVHRAIRETLETTPELLPILNGGIQVGAMQGTLDDKNRTLTLKGASGFDGTQTRGMLKEHLEAHPEDGGYYVPMRVVITSNRDLLNEMSISHNFRTAVTLTSIMNKRGNFSKLVEVMAAEGEEFRCMQGDDYSNYDISHLLKVVLVSMPYWVEGQHPASKYSLYGARTKLLKRFENIYIEAKTCLRPEMCEEEQEAIQHSQELYHTILDLAPAAWRKYTELVNSNALAGRRYRWIEREDDGTNWLPDGVILPVMAALSCFLTSKRKVRPRGVAKKDWTEKKAYVYTTPDGLEERLIRKAGKMCSEQYGGSPALMGRDRMAYEVLITMVESVLSERKQRVLEEL